MAKSKQEIITFKVDESLARLIRRIPNRSQFIRGALLAALNGICPLCQGSGILSADQKEHWSRFTEHHQLRECPECEAVIVECEYDPPEDGR
jgi:hypothetical protein